MPEFYVKLKVKVCADKNDDGADDKSENESTDKEIYYLLDQNELF